MRVWAWASKTSDGGAQLHGGFGGDGRFDGAAAGAAHAVVAAAAAAAVAVSTAAVAACVHAGRLVCVHAAFPATAAWIFAAVDTLLDVACASAAASPMKAANAMAPATELMMGLTHAHAHRLGERSRASHPREWVDHRPCGAARTREWAASTCPLNLKFSTSCNDRENGNRVTKFRLRSDSVHS